MTQKVLPAAACLLLCIPVVLPFTPAQEPPALPDLSVGPGDIRFTFMGEEIPLFSQDHIFLTIEVLLHNNGPGPSSGTCVTFLDNGAFLALVPVEANLSGSGPDNVTYVEFTWYIRHTPPGNHTIRVEASDPAGDADPQNNAAEKSVRIHVEAPVVSVRFDTASRSVRVTETEPSPERFTGSVVVDHPPGPVEVTLEAVASTGWNCSLNWTSMVIWDTALHDFSVTVTVPPRTNHSEYGNLRLTARATMDDMSAEARTNAIIAVDPYFGVEAVAQRSHLAIEPGEEAEFVLKVRNTGNAYDSYEVRVLNLDALSDADRVVILSAVKTGALHPMSTYDLTVLVQTHADWAPYIDQITDIRIKITSDNAKDYHSDVHTEVVLIVQEKGFHLPSIGLIGLVALLAVAGALAARRLRRRRPRPKSAAEWDRELRLG